LGCVIVVAAGGCRLVLVGLEAIDGDGQATLIALEGGELVADRGDLDEELVHAGFEVGGGEISHRRNGDG